jgi:hypothetical protein
MLMYCLRRVANEYRARLVVAICVSYARTDMADS